MLFPLSLSFLLIRYIFLDEYLDFGFFTFRFQLFAFRFSLSVFLHSRFGLHIVFFCQRS